jgi:uncharacterized cofD-like protein
LSIGLVSCKRQESAIDNPAQDAILPQRCCSTLQNGAIAAFTVPFYDLRHYVKMGITGWAKRKYRYGAYQKLQYDIHYARHRSFFCDDESSVQDHRDRGLCQGDLKMPHVVGIGGGTGLPVLLKGLSHQPELSVSAIVTVFDNGGSTGRLRDGFGMPAVGDLRNCLVALSDPASALATLFQHRFTSAGELDGHALGNLIVAAMYQQTGSLLRAIELASEIMPQKGQAFAVTEMPTTLCAAFRDGSVVRGEYQIAGAGGGIERVWLEPHAPPPSIGVVEALNTADAIVLAPGSLYTSIIPNLLVDGVAEAIRRSAAVKIMVCNLMTQPGETDGFTASDHLRVIESYLGAGVIQMVIGDPNEGRIRAKKYLEAKAEFVPFDREHLIERGVAPVKASLIELQDGKIRHDANKLGSLVANLLHARAAGALMNDEKETTTEDPVMPLIPQACV